MVMILADAAGGSLTRRLQDEAGFLADAAGCPLTRRVYKMAGVGLADAAGWDGGES